MDDDEKVAGAQDDGIRRVYLVYPDDQDDSIDLLELARGIIDRKWTVFTVCSVCTLIALMVALIKEPEYRAEALLAPAQSEEFSSIPGELSSLAGIAGVTLSAGRDKTHAVSILQSRQFVRGFIEDNALMPVLFADKWDGTSSTWISRDSDQIPDIRDGVRLFIDDILFVTKHSDTGLVTLAIEWRDPEVATSWARLLIDRLNQQLRTRDLEESRRRLSYLNEQLQKTELVELRQGISRLIENQIETMMLAQAETEYAFRVIDEPTVPNEAVSPKAPLIVALAFLFGLFFGAFVSAVQWWSSRIRPSTSITS